MLRRRSLETVMQAELVTVSELVQLSGMRHSTLKYYTEIGILPFIQLDTPVAYPRTARGNQIDEGQRNDDPTNSRSLLGEINGNAFIFKYP